MGMTMAQDLMDKGKKEGERERRPLGNGVHSAYEDAMVHAYREKIFAGLKATPKVKEEELIDTGFDAAKRTIAMMRRTFNAIPPTELVQTYIDVGAGGALSPKSPPTVATGDRPFGVAVSPLPRPTTKNQCMHGGWRQFGFKSQGRCIHFVKHGQKA